MKNRIKHSTFAPLAILLFIGAVILTGIASMRGGYWWISAVAAVTLCVLMLLLVAVTDFGDEPRYEPGWLKLLKEQQQQRIQEEVKE